MWQLGLPMVDEKQESTSTQLAQLSLSGGKVRPCQYRSFQDEHVQEDQKVQVKMEKGASLGGTVLTMLNACVGSGTLVLPYAWRLAGWMFAVPFLGIALVMGFTLWLTGFLLQVVDSRAAAMGVPQVNRDWGMLGRMAFGPAGGLFFSTFIFIDLYGCIISFLVIVQNQMEVLLPIPGIALSGIIYALFFLLLFVDTRHFSSIAALGLISMLLAVACLLITGGELTAVGEMAEDQDVLKWEGIPAAAGKEFYGRGDFGFDFMFKGFSAHTLLKFNDHLLYHRARVPVSSHFLLISKAVNCNQPKCQMAQMVSRSPMARQVWLSTPL